MKNAFFLFAFLPIFVFFNPLAQAQMREIECKVVGVSDGDTLTCLYNQKPLKVRLQYIDAPESAQPFGQRSKQTLSALAFKQQVRLLISGYDRYQRLLAVVENAQGENVNLQLVERGMAWTYRQTQPIYQQAQQRAKNARLGLWQDAHPIDPADWRKAKKGENFAQISSPLMANSYAGALNCQQKLSCNQIGRIGDYALAQRYFQQCGWQELDGNRDGIPCNKLYRKARK